MTGAWNPEFWNGLGVVGLAVINAVAFVVSLTREWIVIGRYYRAVVADRDAEIAELRKARATDAETIGALASALSAKNATDEANLRIMTSMRDAVRNQ